MPGSAASTFLLHLSISRDIFGMLEGGRMAAVADVERVGYNSVATEADPMPEETKDILVRRVPRELADRIERARARLGWTQQEIGIFAFRVLVDDLERMAEESKELVSKIEREGRESRRREIERKMKEGSGD
jgi:ribosome-binding protein aMBF1 (putative translation factor)